MSTQSFTSAQRRAAAAIAILAALAGASHLRAAAVRQESRASHGQSAHDEIAPVALQPLAQR